MSDNLPARLTCFGTRAPARGRHTGSRRRPRPPRAPVRGGVARWGSLYDALSGTDAIPQDGDHIPGDGVDPVRADAVAAAKAILDTTAPLTEGRWTETVGFAVTAGRRAIDGGERIATPRDEAEIPEPILDATVTALYALHDRTRRTGSVYRVKPKRHGPEAVAFAVALFGRVEALLGLAPRTLTIVVMDEEWCTRPHLTAMTAAPDQIGARTATEGDHPAAGASTAWAPSPSAATLDALHGHRIDLCARQVAVCGRPTRAAMPTPPLGAASLPPDTVQEALDNSCHGILGDAVRWIDPGIGGSQIPGIHEVGLMEARATLRIASQPIADRLCHEVVDRRGQVAEVQRRMAGNVDFQSVGDPAHRPMAPDCDGPAFRAAEALVFAGAQQPNGYTKFTLHRHRRGAKRRREAKGHHA